MVAPRTTATETQRPQTPLCDKRVYKHAQLDSGVRILVVQDVAAVYAAACASVQVGYFDDPQDLSGAAHFLEHMVHLGSKHFPDDKEYKHFLAQHGGSSNASTSMVHTKYHFKVHNTALEGALQRFISMLSCPLILASSCAGEVQNVHAEYSRNLNSDGRKLLQLRRSLCRPPYSNFSTGSLQTLWEQPQQQGIDVPKALQHLWQQCYKAESICVAVVGPQQPDVLLQWVSEAVANIPSSSNSTDSNASSGSCSNGSNAVSCGNAAGIISEHAQQCYSSDRAMQQHEVASVQPSIATSMCMRYPLDVCNSDETSRGQLVLISPQRQLRDLEVSWYIPSGVMEHSRCVEAAAPPNDRHLHYIVRHLPVCIAPVIPCCKFHGLVATWHLLQGCFASCSLQPQHRWSLAPALLTLARNLAYCSVLQHQALAVGVSPPGA
eukprot:GHRR01026472.1.p1 GENE.GHRR01026472.1~~GHRR01026472.1.p1  ORF type:complete len:484 (+),score=112.71 GHRR01026472.1:146-1453(+)